MKTIFFSAFLFCLVIISRTIVFADEKYDIKHYELFVKPDFKTKIIELNGKILIENKALADTFYFGLNDNYQSVELTCKSNPVEFSHSAGWLTVVMKNPVESISLEFSVKGDLKNSIDEKREVIADSSLFLLWSDRFYPISFDDWATTRLTVELPSGFKCISPGELSSVKNKNKIVEYVFESEIPVVSFSIFADNRWIETEKTIEGLKIKTLLHPESQKFSPQIFTTSSEVISFFSKLHCPYPFNQFCFVTISGMYARRAFPGFVGYSPDYLDKEFSTTGYDAHETSLLWWGYTTRGIGPGSFQWTEGLGDYSELYFGFKTGKPIPENFNRFRLGYLKMPVENDLIYSDLRGNTSQNIVHGKYPWTMRVLHFAIGDSAFQFGTRLLFERFKFGTFTIDEFIGVYEETSGQSLRWWKTEWLERKGIPVFSVKHEIQNEDGKFTITGAVTQTGNFYHLPFEIGIVTETGLQIEKIFLSEVKTSFSFQCETVPLKVMYDPDNWIIKQIYQVSN